VNFLKSALYPGELKKGDNNVSTGNFNISLSSTGYGFLLWGGMCADGA
jgi:hypothetical protein